MRAHRSRTFVTALAGTALLFGLTSCGLAGGASTGSGISVVAAENFWGSIVSQIGGPDVHVTSIIDNPDADPHDYDATPGDARTVARARYVIVNGAGYDAWATRLIDANPESDRTVLTVAGLFGKKDGDNPHLWYDPDYITQFIVRVTADLKKVDPAHASAYDQRSADYQDQGLSAYHGTIATIKSRYAGVAVGASESIFAYLAPALGLALVTPPSYLQAVTEGTDISPADRAAVQRQIASRQIRVFVFNSQNSTPDVQQAVVLARASDIPVSAITESLTPAGATFQDWQTRQLQSLLKALGG